MHGTCTHTHITTRDAITYPAVTLGVCKIRQRGEMDNTKGI